MNKFNRDIKTKLVFASPIIHRRTKLIVQK